MSFAWLQVALGADGGLAKTVKVGDRVKHIGTKQWGKVLRVVQQPDGTAELEIEREVAQPWHDGGTGWWATYHVLEHQPA